jgi:hypothetical protein
MMDYFSDKDFTSDKAFIPSRPPPTRHTDRLSDVPSYYGLASQGSDGDLPTGVEPDSSATATGPTSEHAGLKARRRRNILVILAVVVLLAVIVIAVAIAQANRSHQGSRQPGGGSVSGSGFTSSSWRSTADRTTTRHPKLVSHSTTGFAGYPTTTTTLETQFQTLGATTVFITSTPVVTSPVFVATSFTAASSTQGHKSTKSR